MEKFKLKKEFLKFARKSNAITLIALVITIVILLILSAVILASLTPNGLIARAKQAREEYKTKSAIEMMNLKITSVQLSLYGETQQLSTLQYLADILCEDDDMEYVRVKHPETASLEKIIVGEGDSLVAKLKTYPYEFEINSSLQLESIDGIKLASAGNSGGSGGNASYSNTDVFESLTCSVQQNGNKINVTINPTFKTGKSENDVYEYIVCVNGIAYKSVKNTTMDITNFTPATSYNISVFGIDKNVKLIQSEVCPITTASLTYTRTVLDYPTLFSDGIKNVKYECEQGSDYDYYDLDLTAVPNGTSALPIEAYDGDPTTSYQVRSISANDGGYIRVSDEFKASGAKIKIKTSSLSSSSYIGFEANNNRYYANDGIVMTKDLVSASGYETFSLPTGNYPLFSFNKFASASSAYELYEVGTYIENVN